MRTPFKPSLASRASARALIVACMPAAALAFVADSFAQGPVPGQAANHDLTVEDNAGASTNAPSPHVPGTNNSGNSTNIDWTLPMSGMRG